MKHRDAHEELFDRDHINSVEGAIAAMRRPVPTPKEYPDDAAREYADITIKNVRHITTTMRNSWPPFILQGLRLLVLERIFNARRLLIPVEMQTLLSEIKATPEITATLKRAGLI
jgi:hypothetical protein